MLYILSSHQKRKRGKTGVELRVDVCKDGGIIKKISRKGERGRQPSDLDEVLVKYQVMLHDGTIVSENTEEGIELYINDGHLIPALPRVIKTMTMGEKSSLTVQPQCADGLPLVAPNTALSIDLELVSYKPVTNVTSDSKVVKKIIKEGDSNVVADDGASVTGHWYIYRALLMRFSSFSLSSCSPSPFLHQSSLVNSMASLSSASISSSRPHVLLQSSITNSNGLKPSIAFWRSTQRVLLRLRISCHAKPETVDKVCAIVKKQLAYLIPLRLLVIQNLLHLEPILWTLVLISVDNQEDMSISYIGLTALYLQP